MKAKVYKIEMMVVDRYDLDPDGIKNILERPGIAGGCFDPKVISMEHRDIEQWHSRHPLNLRAEYKKEFEAIFKGSSK